MISLFVRLALTLALIYFVYQETGVSTALAILLLAISNELQLQSLKNLINGFRSIASGLGVTIATPPKK